MAQKSCPFNYGFHTQNTLLSLINTSVCVCVWIGCDLGNNLWWVWGCSWFFFFFLWDRLSGWGLIGIFCFFTSLSLDLCNAVNGCFFTKRRALIPFLPGKNNTTRHRYGLYPHAMLSSRLITFSLMRFAL